MSGHSKWATIKHQKEAKDRARGQTFSKLSRAISVAVIEGGGETDPNANFRLRLAIEQAREANMPKAILNGRLVGLKVRKRENWPLYNLKVMVRKGWR